jgi:hypothetical protein
LSWSQLSLVPVTNPGKFKPNEEKEVNKKIALTIGLLLITLAALTMSAFAGEPPELESWLWWQRYYPSTDTCPLYFDGPELQSGVGLVMSDSTGCQYILSSWSLYLIPEGAHKWRQIAAETPIPVETTGPSLTQTSHGETQPEAREIPLENVAQIPGNNLGITKETWRGGNEVAVFPQKNGDVWYFIINPNGSIEGGKCASSHNGNLEGAETCKPKEKK